MNIWMIVAGVLFLLLFGGTSYYIGFRLYQVAHAYLPVAACNILVGAFVAVTLIFVARFLVIFVPNLKTIKRFINWVSSYWMGAFIYLFLFFILADIVLVIGRCIGIFQSPMPYSIRLYTSAIAICLSIVMIGYGIYHANQIETVSYEIQLTKNPDGDELNLVLISDLHLGAVTSEQKLENIVEKINQMNPDIICIAGDIFDTDYENINNPEKAAETLSQLTARYGVYCCLGNHDAGVTFGKMETFLENSKIRCLNEEYVNIANRFILLGRVDSSPIGNQGNLLRTDTKSLLDSIETQLPIVVLDHNPANLKQYIADADLILCGHTHHGQVWPANFVTAYGYYPVKNNIPQTIITSGIGVWGMPMRVGSSCEIVNIKLR